MPADESTGQQSTNPAEAQIQTIKSIRCRRTLLKVDPAKEKCNATKVTILAIADTNVKKKILKWRWVLMCKSTLGHILCLSPCLHHGSSWEEPPDGILKIWFSDQLKISWNTVVTVIRKIRVGHNNSNQRCSSCHPRMIPQIMHHLQSSTEAQMVKCFSLGTGVFNGNLSPLKSLVQRTQDCNIKLFYRA